MIHRFVLLLFLFLMLASRAQQNIIATADTPVFFEGMPNPIQIIIEKVDSQNLIVEGENCEVTGAFGHYNVIVSLGARRTCIVKAGILNEKQEKVWLKVEEFKIRPQPKPSFTVNGKDGGLVTKSEAMVWNFINASFGPQFMKDGYQLSVQSYEVVFYSLHSSKGFKCKSPGISDSVKWFVENIDMPTVIVFSNFKYTTNYNHDTTHSDHRILFKINQNDIEFTIKHEITDQPANNQTENEVGYSYQGNIVSNQKEGLWITTSNDYKGLKLGEALYEHNQILEERQYYTNGKILSEIKYNYLDSVAFIKTYYPSGENCYNGNYKLDTKRRAVILNYSGSFNGDEIYTENTDDKSRSAIYDAKDKYVTPQKALLGEWEFFYENGILAAKGKFNFYMDTPDGNYDTPPPVFYNVSREGEWLFYDSTGALIRKTNYVRGQTMNETFFTH